MSVVVEIFRSEWREALAGKAYTMIQNDNSKYLDEYEEKRDSREFDSLISKLSALDGKKNWSETMKLLAHRIAIQYIAERITGKSLFPGNKMTLIGHANQMDIEMGFLGSLAAQLDEGATEKLFQQYLMTDFAFQKAINTGDVVKGRELAEAWRLVQIALHDSYESLMEKFEQLS